MPEFRIVPMRLENVAEVMRIADECGLSYWSEGDYASEVEREGSYALLAESAQSGTKAGFIVMRLITNKNNPHPSIFEILNIAAKKTLQKKGVGTQILQYAINLAKQNSPAVIWLEVRASNSLAIEFYRHHGFNAEYTRRNFYSDPVEDGIVMKLDV